MLSVCVRAAGRAGGRAHLAELLEIYPAVFIGVRGLEDGFCVGGALRPLHQHRLEVGVGDEAVL